MNEPNVRVV